MCFSITNKQNKLNISFFIYYNINITLNLEKQVQTKLPYKAISIRIPSSKQQIATSKSLRKLTGLPKKTKTKNKRHKSFIRSYWSTYDVK